LQVILTRGDIPATHPIYEQPQCLIVTTDEAQLACPSTIPLMRCGKVNVDLRLMLEKLKHDHRINVLNVCTGGITWVQLLQLKVINEIRHTISGTILGGADMSMALAPIALSIPPTFRFKSIELLSPHLLRVTASVEYHHHLDQNLEQTLYRKYT
jgi:riboflavin biosynthesis pyrimidine reductase